ncbi:hypothetical protein EGW08_022673 [Elysia chlorotica]|uniref:Neurotransmitter-gated ion-channel ligand-binding domain-containing protein n=1 Tax=Elysia chlorotica TaxID=188477 RepID=A0A3S0ZKJ7_ELYCH|nr:hypothetical protein EGW08_022673 [Elysia chlorotica]
MYIRVILAFSILLDVAHASGGGAEDMSRLLKTLLTNYSSNVLPIVNKSKPVDVSVGIGIMTVVNLDTRSQVLHLRGYVKMSWTDYLLGWDPKDYGNISYVILPQDTIWKPDIIMGNSLRENIYVGSEETRLFVGSQGYISWQPFFTSEFQCEVDVTKYPMDINICPITINSWMHDTTYIKMSAMHPHTMMESTVFNGQFSIEVAEPITSAEVYDGLKYDFLHFRIRLLRRPSYTFVSMLLPMFVIGLLNVISFMIPSDNSEKVSLSLNVLLATAVFIGVVHGDLPDRSDKISSVAIYVISLLILSFLGVLGNTLVLLLHRHDQASCLPGPEGRHGDGYVIESCESFDNSNMFSDTDQPCGTKQLSHSRLLTPIPNGKKNKTTTEKSSGTGQTQRRRQDVPSVNVVGVPRPRSRASSLNHILLMASAVSLFSCTAAVLGLIMM